VTAVTTPAHPADGARGGPGARGRILAAARVLFHRRGINATGIAELCAAAHVSKRSLYVHFRTKDDVVAAYLDGFEDDRSHPPAAVLARTDLAPRARLLELFTALADDSHPMRGSPVLNAAVELADPAHPVHRLAAEHHRRFTERLANLYFTFIRDVFGLNVVSFGGCASTPIVRPSRFSSSSTSPNMSSPMP